MWAPDPGGFAESDVQTSSLVCLVRPVMAFGTCRQRAHTSTCQIFPCVPLRPERVPPAVSTLSSTKYQQNYFLLKKDATERWPNGVTDLPPPPFSCCCLLLLRPLAWLLLCGGLHSCCCCCWTVGSVRCRLLLPPTCSCFPELAPPEALVPPASPAAAALPPPPLWSEPASPPPDSAAAVAAAGRLRVNMSFRLRCLTSTKRPSSAVHAAQG